MNANDAMPEWLNWPVYGVGALWMAGGVVLLLGKWTPLGKIIPGLVTVGEQMIVTAFWGYLALLAVLWCVGE